MLLRVDGQRIRLRYQRPWSRNSFASVYAAQLHPSGGGTTITGTFGLHPVVRIFLLVWTSLVALISGVMLVIGILRVTGVSPIEIQGDTLVFVIVPVMFVVTAVVLRLAARHGGAADRREITAFLTETLEAREVQPHMA